MTLAERMAPSSTRKLPHGAEWRSGVGTHFRLWAPGQDRIDLVIEGRNPLPLDAQPDGWHEILVETAEPGTRYQFGLDSGLRVPDPASRYQPDDVHGPSQVMDPGSYAWGDGGWAGRPWPELVLYELHVGTFSPEGTFRGAIGKLGHLRDLGVTAIELMPLSDFSGRWNWGYDGVLPYAPDSAYGHPDDLKALVDAAHRAGIAVLLDVVYNHFGPDGNYLSAYAPGFFTDRHHTPWGAAINYDGAHSLPVRDFIIHNALYWVEEFHLDGFRLDAVHAIIDDGDLHLLDDLASQARAASPHPHLHLILENEENDARHLARSTTGDPTTYTAQWNDDVHHVLHVAATGEGSGYYVDYLDDTAKLGRALAQGFAFQGEMMPYRGRPRGEPSLGLPPLAFVAFIQNHDQIGNRALGDRITAAAPTAAVRAISAVYLLLPQIPMLFMGEEWAAAQPFPFFCDFGGELADAVRKGRLEEFSRFPEFRDAAMRSKIPDPLDAATFRSAQLDWTALAAEPHRSELERYRALLQIRHRDIVPFTARLGGHSSTHEVAGRGAVKVSWTASGGDILRLHVNLKGEAEAGLGVPAGTGLWTEGEASADGLGPYAVCWTLEQGSRS